MQRILPTRSHGRWDGPMRGSTDFGEMARAALLATSAGLWRLRFLGWNHGQQQIGLPAGAEVQAGDAAEHGLGAVARVVVQERPAARELVLEIRQLAPAGTMIDIVV